MAEIDFEDDLRAMFDAAPPASDAAAFAAKVNRRIAQRQRMGLMLVLALGLAGLGMAFALFHPSLAGLGVDPSTLSIASFGDIGLWSVGIVVLMLGWAGFQLVASEA